MPWPQTGATHYHAQIGPSDKGQMSCNQGLVVSIARINDLWDEYMDKRKVRGLLPCFGQDGYRAQVPQCLLDL